MTILSLKTWRRAMSIIVFLFGLNVLYLVYLIATTVPAGIDPQTAGQNLARDPRFDFSAMILAGLFLAGLVLAVFRLVYAGYARVTKPEGQRLEVELPTSRYSRCPVCAESILHTSLGRNLRTHLRNEHVDYWRWRWKWSVLFTSMLVAWVILLFPFLLTGVIPGARGGATSATLYGIGAYASVEVLMMVLGIWASYRRTRQFRDEWKDQHPLHLRTYGNLKGIKARVKFKTGRTALLKDPFIPLELLHPASFLIVPVVLLLGRFTLRKVRLDRVEDKTLWLYDAFDTLTSFRIESLPAKLSDDGRITLGLERGSLEIRPDNPADIETVRSILSVITHPTT